MKNSLMIIFILCAVSIINANAECTYEVYNRNITKDGWALAIFYSNNCNFDIKVEITYQVAFRRGGRCDAPWSYKTETEIVYLPANRGSRIIGNAGPNYDDCTRRYNLISYRQIN